MPPITSNTQSTAKMFAEIAAYAASYRDGDTPIHPTASVDELRKTLRIPLGDTGRDPQSVLTELTAGVEPGLVGVTQPGFHAWVMGASHPAGVAADLLTSVWGQNAGIYQSAPAAAIAEEAVIDWLLEMLDLPRTASVGLTTGATMANFICLAAARGAVLRRAGFDIAQTGLQGADKVNVFISAESHSSNFAALRYLGFGEANLVRIPADEEGVLDELQLDAALSNHSGPAIVICQAGHIHTGAFDRFEALSRITRQHEAWLHVDGAFGLWARALPELAELTRGIEHADSWSVDGHKWLQVPYDCGFAIVRDAEAHRLAMDISAGYLPASPDDGRNPTHFGPEISRRARGFAVWAIMQSLGRDGITGLIRNHCACATALADRLVRLEKAEVVHAVVLNQVSIWFGATSDGAAYRNALTQTVCDALNESGDYFVKTAEWNGRTILRFSFSGATTKPEAAGALADAVERALS